MPRGAWMNRLDVADWEGVAMDPRRWQRRGRVVWLLVAVTVAVPAFAVVGYRMTPEQRIVRGMNRIEMPANVQFVTEDGYACVICVGEKTWVERGYSADLTLGQVRDELDAAFVNAGFHRRFPGWEEPENGS